MAKGRRANGEGAPVHRPDGRWEVKFYVKDPLSGLVKRRSAYGQRRVDAIDKMNAILERAARGAPLQDAKATLGSWVTQWVTVTLPVLPISANYRDQTVSLARSYLTKGPFAAQPLDQLRPSSVEALISDLQSRTKTVQVRGKQVEQPALSPSTIRSVFLVLRKALDAAVRDGLLAKNPAAEVKSPRVPRQAVVNLKASDVAKLLASLRSTRYFPAYALIAATGMRRGECLGLGLEDVDLENRVAYIHLTLSAAKGGPRESQTKTDGSRRRVMFPEPVAGLLKVWSRQQAAERLAAGADWEASGKVFTTETGGVVDPRAFLRTLQAHAKALGLPAHVGIHTLRHSAATAMLEAGVHVKAVADSLGHSSAQITLDTYGFTVDSVARAAADGLATSFGITVDAPEEDGTAGGNVVSLR